MDSGASSFELLYNKSCAEIAVRDYHAAMSTLSTSKETCHQMLLKEKLDEMGDEAEDTVSDAEDGSLSPQKESGGGRVASVSNDELLLECGHVVMQVLLCVWGLEGGGVETRYQEWQS